MNPDLSCYGPTIDGLADLVGDFVLRSSADVQAWYAIQWQALAQLLGFTQQLEATPTVRSTDPIGAAQHAGLAAYERSLRDARPAVSDAQARVQLAALQHLAAVGRERGELWRTSIDPTTLPTGACYTEGTQALRAFYPDTAPGYFGEGWDGPRPRAASACGWQTPLVLHLGTFPWVYSSRIDGAGPGMRWVSPTTLAALGGLQIATSLMEPATNLRQDARQVAAILQHFTRHTAPLLARVPVFQPGRAEPGTLYRRNGFLHVHQGSLHVVGLDGPRGRLSALAYNHVLRRFACFFAVRRAALRDLSTLPADLQRIVHNSADPCLRQHAEEVARAG